MLNQNPHCQTCGCALTHDSPDARICSFECTFCATCADARWNGICPNCGGELLPRPRRAVSRLSIDAHLYVGNRNYSSWSLRAWLSLKWAGVEFSETLIDLDQPGYGKSRVAEVLAISPTGKVPALYIGSNVIYDSLAIAEWAADNARLAHLLPGDTLLRAKVRSAMAEMHSGFAPLRRDLTMNIRRRCVAYGLPAETLADIARIDQLFKAARDEHAAAGPYLFGQRSLADAFFVPVATRFRTYGIALSVVAQSYCDHLLSDEHFKEWEQRVLDETPKPFTRANFESMYLPHP